MARKRRKDQHGDEGDKKNKKLKSSHPQDTNDLEILPGKAPLVKQDELPSHVRWTGFEADIR